MRMTANRKLILLRLDRGPATTGEIRDMLGVAHFTAYECLRRLAEARTIKGSPLKGTTVWEIDTGEVPRTWTTRQIAKEAGDKVYVGKCCPHGHNGIRLTANGACVDCHSTRSRRAA